LSRSVPQILRLPWRSVVSPSVPRLNRSALEPQRSALAGHACRLRTAAQCSRLGLAARSSWSWSYRRSATIILVLPQRSALVLVLQRARLGLGLIAGLLRSSWSCRSAARSSWSCSALVLVFTNLSFPAQSCTTMSVDHAVLGRLRPTDQPLCSFVALASGGSPIVCASSSLVLPASCIVGSANFFHRWSFQHLSRCASATASPAAAAAGNHASTALLRPTHGERKGIITYEDPRPHGMGMCCSHTFLVVQKTPKRHFPK